MIKEHDDLFYLRRCLKLAQKGAGLVSPNPLVGAVIVKQGKIIGEGYHKKAGEAHAEINALNSVTTGAEGAILYCNLEPCCHTDKKTAPCIPRIIKDGIKRVVISSLDPNPQVNGKGVEQLHKANIEVQTGILDYENRELNRFFYKYISQKSPYITIKIAQSLDGYIALPGKKPIWLSCKESKKLVHRWRSIYDAVLIGVNTAIVDNPSLTVREVKGRNPKRIIVDGQLRLTPDHNLFNDGLQINTILITGKNSPYQKLQQIHKKGVSVFTFDSDDKGRIPLDQILIRLARHNITSILVEGGQNIFSHFIKGNYADEIIMIISPQFLGSGISSLNRAYQIKNDQYKLVDLKQIGRDIFIHYRRIL
jgi:diaminohydroxyphosphoribosylaminopyrimidine deaminase/5-amino-6-(5-phosphoribosylamino)uracil reductase